MKRRVLIEIRIGNFFSFPEDGTENRIDKPGASCSPELFGQLNRFIHCRRSRRPRQEEDLIESEAENIDNIGFNFFKGNFRKLPDGPVEPASPTEDTVGQFCEKGSIKRRQVSIALEGVGQEIIRVRLRVSRPLQDIETDRPRTLRPQNLPVLAISSSLAIRSSIGGWVLKRERTPPPWRGLTINIWAVEGLASMGIRWEAISSFPRAPAK